MDQFKSDNNSETSLYNSEKLENCYGISILNTGPRGGAYQNSNGDTFMYTIFRVEVFNDTIIPTRLDVNFPNCPIGLLPDSSLVFEVFMIPKFSTPETTIQDTSNFGVKLEDLFESGHNY